MSLYHFKLKTRNSPKKVYFLKINKMSTCFVNFFWIKFAHLLDFHAPITRLHVKEKFVKTVVH